MTARNNVPFSPGCSIQLYNGDCLEIMEQMPEKSIDMVLVDPPYGTTRNKWDKIIPLKKMWKQICRVAKDDAAIVIFGSGMFTADCMRSAPKKMWRYNLIWEKTEPTGFLNANKMPLRSHEDIMVFYRNPPVYHPQKTGGHERKVSSAASKRNCKETSDYGKHGLTSYDSTERHPTSVWRFCKDKQHSAIHSTQKPVALLEKLILSFTDAQDTVLDFTSGSCSTGEACYRTGRRFVGIEKDLDIFEDGKNRMIEITGYYPIMEGERWIKKGKSY